MVTMEETKVIRTGSPESHGVYIFSHILCQCAERGRRLPNSALGCQNEENAAFSVYQGVWEELELRVDGGTIVAG
jgi:hypothetical protein